MALTDLIDSITPSWAKERAHWWGMFRLGAVLIDALIEGVYQGRKAGLPNAVDLPGIEAYGGFEDVRSLAYLGEDLSVPRGLVESPAAYAYRLRHAQDDAGGWLSAGLVAGVLEQLAGVLGPNPPLMRIVNRQGRWWTRLQDGTLLYQTPAGDGRRYNTDGTVELDATVTVAWLWDHYTDPPVGNQDDPGDWFLILYQPLNTPYGVTNDGTFADPGKVQDTWDDPHAHGPDPGPWAGTVGTNAPACLVELIRGVAEQRACPAFRLAWIIEARNAHSFKPDGTSTGTNAYPDGHWGRSTKYDPGTNTQVPSRLSSAEYWPGAPGGLAP